MALVIAQTALVALELSGAPFHEPFHADGRQPSTAVTECSGRNQAQRYRNLTTDMVEQAVEQIYALPN